MAAYASLENTKLFPPWRNLPFVNDKHSIFLANIQEFDGFLRYRTVVKDRDGELCIVAFYPDSYEGFDFHQLKRDHTLAIVNAVQHHFVDGTHGVRVESMHDVCVLTTSLQAILELCPNLDKESGQWVCHGCEASKPIKEMRRCGQCKAYAYCSKECQAKGWNEKGHKLVCKILRAANLSMLTLA